MRQPLVVGKVPVETVEFVQRQQVDVAFDIFDREEMAAGIEHGSPISHARLVPHDHGRNVARIRHRQLQQALQPVKYALRRTAANRYAFARYSEQILLRPERMTYGKPYRPARVSIRWRRSSLRRTARARSSAKNSAEVRSGSGVTTTVREVIGNEPFPSVTASGRGMMPIPAYPVAKLSSAARSIVIFSFMDSESI